MEIPPEVSEYRKLALEKNQIDAKLKKLRPNIMEILNETGGFEDFLYLTPVEKTTWHDDILYEWISKTYPDLAPKVAKSVVDWDKLGEFAKLGLVDIDDIPLYCRTVEKTYSIQTRKKKKEVDETQTDI